MPRVSDSRAKMLRSAAKLFRRQGYAATGWRQVVEDSQTPWGSQAHNFPGGKEQLAVDALSEAGREYAKLLKYALAEHEPSDAVRMWADAAARELERSGWTKGCPIATVALETSAQSEALAEVCHEAFTSWIDEYTQAFIRVGITDGAEELALTVLAGVEGALLLARAARDGRPLRAVGDQLSALIASKLPGNGA